MIEVFTQRTVDLFKAAATDDLTLPPKLYPHVFYVVIIALCFELSRYVIDPIWTGIAVGLGAPNEDKKHKFRTQMTNLWIHVINTLFLWGVTAQERWFEDTTPVWGQFPNQFQPPHYLAFYCFACGYHLQRLVRVLCEERKEDYFEMLLHHAVTVFLLACSFHLGYIRIGLMVLYVHDSSDILVCIAKMWNYCGWKKMALVFFIPMTALWGYERVMLLPYPVIYCCIFEHLAPGFEISKWACIFCLCVLVLLNGYWFSLFLKMMLQVVKTPGNLPRDMQEEKGEEKRRAKAPTSPQIRSDD